MPEMTRGALQDWIVSYGGKEKLAKKLRVSPHAVDFWCCKKGWPKVGYIIAIIKLSNGTLDFKSIVNSTSKTKQL